MKHFVAVLCLIAAASSSAAEPKAPEFHPFPNPGREWSNADNLRVDDGQFSWRHYKHDRTGDVAACVAWYTPKVGIDSSPVRQASIETITSTGYAFASVRKLGEPIDDILRHRDISFSVRNHSADHRWNFRAIEYSYVYEQGDGDSEPALAHGYVVAVGDFTIFIQHTANRVFTSETTRDLASQVVVAWSKEQTSITKGWRVSITRPDN